MPSLSMQMARQLEKERQTAAIKHGGKQKKQTLNSLLKQLQKQGGKAKRAAAAAAAEQHSSGRESEHDGNDVGGD